MFSMLIMVNSFRPSLETWLEHAPADLSFRARDRRDGFLTAEEQARIAATPGLGAWNPSRQNWLLARSRPWYCSPFQGCRPPPLPGRSITRAWDPPPVWGSRYGDLYHWQSSTVRLPIAGQSCPSPWPAYARLCAPERRLR